MFGEGGERQGSRQTGASLSPQDTGAGPGHGGGATPARLRRRPVMVSEGAARPMIHAEGERGLLLLAAAAAGGAKLGALIITFILLTV